MRTFVPRRAGISRWSRAGPIRVVPVVADHWFAYIVGIPGDIKGDRPMDTYLSVGLVFTLLLASAVLYWLVGGRRR